MVKQALSSMPKITLSLDFVPERMVAYMPPFATCHRRAALPYSFRSCSNLFSYSLLASATCIRDVVYPCKMLTANSSCVHLGRYEWGKLLRLSLEKLYEIVMAWELLGTQTRRPSCFLRTRPFGDSKVETLEGAPRKKRYCSVLYCTHGCCAPILTQCETRRFSVGPHKSGTRSSPIGAIPKG